jgi:hypothetical protein
MNFYQVNQIECNVGFIPIFQSKDTDEPYTIWLKLKDVIGIMLLHERENLVRNKLNNDLMISLNLALNLLLKMELEDFSIGSTINNLKAYTSKENLPVKESEEMSEEEMGKEIGEEKDEQMGEDEKS